MADHEKTSTEKQSDPAAPPPDAAPTEIKVEGDPARIERLEREVSETRDRMLRIAADFENFKKRARREQDEAAARGRESLLKELLGVLDNLERAIAAAATATGSPQALVEGVKLVDRQFHTLLEKFDVRRFDAQGQPFDPSKHEAIQQVETAEVPPGAVAQVFARGYMMGERLLRPAIVAVAKAPAAATVPKPGDADSGETVH